MVWQKRRCVFWPAVLVIATCLVPRGCRLDLHSGGFSFRAGGIPLLESVAGKQGIAFRRRRGPRDRRGCAPLVPDASRASFSVAAEQSLLETGAGGNRGAWRGG